VPVATICAGLAWGMLVAAVGLALWDGSRPTPGLSRAVWVIGWLAGTLLLAGAMLAWWEGYRLSSLAWRLILMAALAAPSGIRHHHRSPWNDSVRTLLALILAGVALFLSAEPGVGNSNSPVTPMELAMVLCGGLGARALGEALCEIIDQTSHVKWPALSKVEGPSAVTWALLTLLVSGTALGNLWQRGMIWKGAIGEGMLAGTWLAWSAAWLSPHERPRLRAALVTVAALLLFWTALRFP
jgi:hypothetical protein